MENKLSEANRIWSMLDMTLRNFDWMITCVNGYDLPMISDHSPMILKFHAAPQMKKNSFLIFQFSS